MKHIIKFLFEILMSFFLGIYFFFIIVLMFMTYHYLKAKGYSFSLSILLIFIELVILSAIYILGPEIFKIFKKEK